MSPLIFFSTHFVHLLLQMVIQFIIKYSRDIDLTFVTSFSFSLFFMISTVLLMMTQSIAQAFFHDKMKMSLSSVYLMLVIISCLLLPLILSLVFPNHCTLLCIAGWSPIPFQNLTFSWLLFWCYYFYSFFSSLSINFVWFFSVLEMLLCSCLNPLNIAGVATFLWFSSSITNLQRCINFPAAPLFFLTPLIWTPKAFPQWIYLVFVPFFSRHLHFQLLSINNFFDCCFQLQYNLVFYYLIRFRFQLLSLNVLLNEVELRLFSFVLLLLILCYYFICSFTSI